MEPEHQENHASFLVEPENNKNKQINKICELSVYFWIVRNHEM